MFAFGAPSASQFRETAMSNDKPTNFVFLSDTVYASYLLAEIIPLAWRDFRVTSGLGMAHSEKHLCGLRKSRFRYRLKEIGLNRDGFIGISCYTAGNEHCV